MSNQSIAEIAEWQARCGDLSTSNEQLREERDAALTLAAEHKLKHSILWERVTELEQAIKNQQAIIDRLRLHIQQGVEL
jgi:hypothetical protein